MITEKNAAYDEFNSRMNEILEAAAKKASEKTAAEKDGDLAAFTAEMRENVGTLIKGTEELKTRLATVETATAKKPRATKKKAEEAVVSEAAENAEATESAEAAETPKPKATRKKIETPAEVKAEDATEVEPAKPKNTRKKKAEKEEEPAESAEIAEAEKKD